MSTKYFTSVLKLVDVDCAPPNDGSDSSLPLPLQVDAKESRLTLPADQPHPPHSCSSGGSLCFDKIIPSDASASSLYKQTAKEVVAGALLGYHGTVITFSSSKTQTEQANFTWSPSDGMIRRAVRQITRCLKKSKSKSSASNLLIQCSYVAVINEEVWDLLSQFTSSAKSNGADVSSNGARMSSQIPPGPKLEVIDDVPHGASQCVATSSAEVADMLNHGNAVESTVLDMYDSNLRDGVEQHTHHKIFTLTVEFSQFGTMNAPVSGNLVFVDVAISDPLASRRSYTIEDRVDKAMQSLFTFADTIQSLSSNIAALDSINSSQQAFSWEPEVSSLPTPYSSPSSSDSDLRDRSVLTRVIRESLGGNCKTLMITYVPTHLHVGFRSELLETLKLASRARIIQNTPNKRDLAEKALMSAYLRGLEEMYGPGMGGNSDQHGNGDGGGKETATGAEERQKNMELAVNALVAATLEENGEYSEDSGSDSDGGSLVWSGAGGAGGGSRSDRGSKMARKRSRAVSLARVKSVDSGTSLSEEQTNNVTLEALVAILQDPDDGVPRPPPEVLKNVKIKKDAGALFSGAAITQWLLTNISGVGTPGDAQTLGQMLLDSGHIFHSEGSSVFADAETLFYHARYARTNRKLLSLEEIQALLKSGSCDANQTVDADAKNGAAEHQGQGAGKEQQGDGKATAEFGKKDDTATTDIGREDATREEWMVQEEEEEEEEEEEVENTTGPNTAPLRKLPTIQTLESSINYPHPLHMAVAIGKSSAVVRELVMMYGVNQLDKSGRTPLMFAALGNNKGSSCATLLRCGAEVDTQDISGLTALHVACYHGNKSAAKVLLSSKATIAMKDNLGHSTLHWSMVSHDYGCLKLLSRSSVHPDLLNAVDTNGLTAVHWCIFYNHPLHLHLLLTRYNKANQMDLKKLDSDGRTLATYAIDKQSPLCLKELLNSETSLQTLADHQGSTPLHHASCQGSIDCLHVLLDFKPPRSLVMLDLDKTDQRQWTCLHYAVAFHRVQAAALLVSRGARVDIQDSEGMTTIDHASVLTEGREEMLAALKGEGVSEDNKPEPVTKSRERSELQRSKVCSLM